MRKRGRDRGKGDVGEGEWGWPTHYFRLKSCTGYNHVDQCCRMLQPDSSSDYTRIAVTTIINYSPTHLFYKHFPREPGLES